MDVYTISLPPNFCYNVHLWMNYGCASFYNFWKHLSMVFWRVFSIAPRGWFAPNIFPHSCAYNLTFWENICASHVFYKFLPVLLPLFSPVQSANICFGFTICHREAAFTYKLCPSFEIGQASQMACCTPLLNCWGPSLTVLPLQPPAPPGALPSHLTHLNLPYTLSFHLFSSTLMSLSAPLAIFQMPETPLYPNAHVTSLI